MSFTLPESFKRPNILENWVVLLGYNKSFKTTGASNKLNEALDSTETGINVDTGSAFTAGDFIRVGTERIKVVSVSSNTLTVVRSVNGVVTTHSDNAQIFFDNFTPISFADTYFESVYSRGVITSEPSIRESIDLEKSTAKTGNVTIKMANFKYQGVDFSKELFNGDRSYVNRICKIYIQPNTANLRADSLLVYTGRLINFNHNHGSITLSIEARTPWDGVEIPQVKTSRGNYYPIAYGDYTPNDGTELDFNSGSDIDDYKKRITLYPIPIERQKGLTLFALSGDWSQSANAYPHFYEKATDALIPLANDDSTFSSLDTANEVYEDGYAVKFHQNLVRASLIKVDQMTEVSNSSPFTWASNQNATDGDLLNTNTSQRCTIIGDFVDNAKGTTKFSMPNLVGFPLLLQVNFSFTCTITLASSSGSGQIQIQLIDESFGNNQILGYWAFTGNATSNSTFVKTAGGNNDTSSLFYFQNPYSTSSNMLADGNGFGGDLELSLKCFRNGNLTGELTGTLELFDIGIRADTAIDFSETTKAGKSIAGKTLSDIEYVYSGGDGLPDNGWNSGGAITEIHEAHRDLLERFTDFRNHENLNYGASRHPTNWSSGTNVNSIKDWGIRYWVNEPILLSKALEELQYNGGFIGRYNSQGEYCYNFIPDSITTDFTITKKEISNLEISLTPFSKVITSMDIEYQKHPATNKYKEKIEATNSTSITAYDIESNENKKTIKLNALVSAPASAPATNPNDDFYTYYNNIMGSVKHLLSFTVINPSYFGIDVGDFLAFDDIGVDPFGGSWSSRDFIVISLSRKRGELKIKAREI